MLSLLNSQLLYKISFACLFKISCIIQAWTGCIESHNYANSIYKESIPLYMVVVVLFSFRNNISMSKRLTLFNDDWLKQDEFKLWLQKVNSKTAKCTLCLQQFDISNMGKSAIKSHSKGKRHNEKLRTRNSMSTLYFQQSSSSNVIVEPLDSVVSTTAMDIVVPPILTNDVQKQTTIPNLATKSSTTEAEILWTLKTLLSHNSYRSCENISDLFKRMFNDSIIAKSFSLGKTKCAYYTNFGIAPYFKDILLKNLKSAPYFVTSYDESMNRILQEEQMDIVIRYFNDGSGLVETRYFDSAFLKRPNAANLQECLLNKLSSLEQSKMLQLSMDGPNVNWDVLRLHHEYRLEKEFPGIVNIGSCGLHILHGALRTGVTSTDWELGKLL